ncbi:MAG: peroxiredoxin [Alphaproteobacteria bacterium]
MKRLVSLIVVGCLTIPAAASAALKSGDAAPSFHTQASLAGKPYAFDLDTALRSGPVVLYFFPAAFTSGCTAEAHAFAEASEAFKAQGASLIGVTSGNIDRVQEFSVSECRNKFAVAADPGAKIARSYKAVLGPMSMSDRTSYVITPDHKIAYVYSALRPDDHVKNTLDAVKAWRRANP